MNTFVLSLIATCAARDVITLPMIRKSKSTLETSLNRIERFNQRANVFSNTPLANEGDALYTCPVHVAHQLLYLDLDTGSSDTWVFGSNCTNPNNDGSCNATKVDLSDPSISKIAGAPQFQIIYGLGNVTGDIYMANVSIGGDGATFPIGVASIANDMAGSDGLMGLAFNSLSSIAFELNQTELPPYPNHNTNFFDQLNFPKEQNMFSFYLSNSHDNDTGEVTFGGYDKSKFTGDIHWVDVAELGIFNLGYNRTKHPNDKVPMWWTFDLNGWTVSLDSKNTSRALKHESLVSNLYNYSIADTGTTLLMLGYDIAKKINDAIPTSFEQSHGNWNVSCEVIPTLPSMTISHQGVDFVIPPEVYIWEAAPGQCISGIGGSDNGSPDYANTAIFGDIFLRSVFSIYDKSQEKPRLGFAKAVHPTKPVATTTSAGPVATTTSAGSNPAVTNTSAGATVTGAASGNYVQPNKGYVADSPVTTAPYKPIYNSATSSFSAVGLLALAFLLMKLFALLAAALARVPDGVVMPYVDTPTFFSGPTHNGSPDVVGAIQAEGVKYYRLAFITANPTTNNLQFAGQPFDFYVPYVQNIRNAQGDIVLSFGGANAVAGGLDEPSAVFTNVNSAFNAYKKVIDTYQPAGLDFDIENGDNSAAVISRRFQVIQMIKDTYPDLTISLTVSVETSGLLQGSLGYNVVQQAGVATKNYGKQLIDVVNIMAMVI
ncbi:hypothetical protein HK103_003199 [Boothiomyces macroporosus]|uniref:Peptidase A1 domain-containing protein n=1 Tax=Boothiomyces macroporosus TaxID=261099 RepID=A0AAD5U919_9FUNG|nr:hypothetical protein HK103_003199 [Boothiomyces macroporosus]